MIDQVRPGDLAKWIQSCTGSGEAIVLDVREPSELQVAAITSAGFELVTIPMGTIPLRLNELDPSRPIACLCHHGGRSMQVAAFLERQGFTKVANVSGGIHAWSVEVDPSIAQY